MQIFQRGNKNRCTINGVSYTGNNIYIDNGIVIIDGKQQKGMPISGPITVNIIGDVETIDTASGDVNVDGLVGELTTTSGDVECGGVQGNVKTTSGDIKCGDIAGNVQTTSGNVK